MNKAELIAKLQMMQVLQKHRLMLLWILLLKQLLKH